jgi:hypothetical protein
MKRTPFNNAARPLRTEPADLRKLLFARAVEVYTASLGPFEVIASVGIRT